MASKTTDSNDPITDINITPLVDVALVLVIIFMAVAPFAVRAGINVLQSKSNVEIGKASASENVQVRLYRDGRITVNDKPTDFQRFFQTVAGALALSKDKMVIISADDKNKVGQVVQLMDKSKQAGAVKLSLMKN